MPESPESTEHSGSPARRPSSWNSRPLFLSSTFADMHFERDYLRVHAFAELEERLRERRHYLETIDLRQGVETTSEENVAARELKVLKVCLDEIARSRPFFAGIIGDRYGWVPPHERMESAAGDAGFGADVAGRSVTELEIMYGVLESSDQRTRSWFYIRELDYDGMPDEVRARFDDRYAQDAEAPGRVRLLEDLKHRLREELPDRVRTYQARWDPDAGENGAVVGLEDLARQVRDDLWSDMDAETQAWLRDSPGTWQDTDLRALDEFTEDRTRGFVERPAVTDPLIAFALAPSAEGDNWGLCLTGESGSGKSSVFGHLYQTLRNRGDVLVLANAAGIYPRSGSVDAMLRRWIHELAGFLGVDSPLKPAAAKQAQLIWADDPMVPRASGVPDEEIEKAFASLLGQVSAKTRAVILIDALNQFERTKRAQYLTWLPKLWPENARLVATAIPGVESDELGRRAGVAVSALKRVTPAEARGIAVRYYGERFHREPNDRVLDVLLSKRRPDGQPACGNPLWLELALQEMNLLRADDYARAERDFPELDGAERIEALQIAEAQSLPGDAAGVYRELLARAEGDFGEIWTGTILNLIALGRAGWRESDLAALIEAACGLPWDDLAFAGLRRTLGSHLVQRGAHAQWDVFHAQLRECVLARNLSDEQERRRLHGLLADHLLELPSDDPLRISETMVHLIGLGDTARAARYYGGLSDDSAELLEASAVLAHSAAAGGSGLEFLAGLPSASGLTDDEMGSVAHHLQFEGVDALGALEHKLALLSACRETQERLAHADPSGARWQHDLCASDSRMGDVLTALGDLGGALRSYRASKDVAQLGAEGDPSNPRWQRALSISAMSIGDVLSSQGNLSEALESYRASMDAEMRLAASDPSNAARQSVFSRSAIRVGDTLLAQGKTREAMELYRASMSVAERVAASDPSNAAWQRSVSVSSTRLGDALLNQGSLDEALESYRAAQAVLEHLRDSDPSDAEVQRGLSMIGMKIGDVLLDQENPSEALESCRASIAVAERLVQSDPSNSRWQHDLGAGHGRIGDVLLAQGNHSGALESYGASVAVLERLAGSDPANARWQRDLGVIRRSLGDVLLARGNPHEALESYGVSRVTLERLVESAPSNAGWQHDLSVSIERTCRVLLEEGNLRGALESYRASIEAAARAAGSNPQYAEWQHHLGVGCGSVGNALLEQGNTEDALEFYRASVTALERAAVSSPSDRMWRHDLGVSHERIGDVLLARGDTSDALESYGASEAVLEDLVESDDRSNDWPGYLIARRERIGDALQARGSSTEALRFYTRAREAAEHLAKTDPSNPDWHRDVGVSSERIGDALMSQDDVRGALEAYRVSRRALERLVECDPSNVAWQHGLSLRAIRIGNVLFDRREMSGSLEFYRASKAVLERLIEMDPSSAVWQNNLGVSCNSTGDVLRSQGDPVRALESYMDALWVTERLAESDPSDADLQRNLAVSHFNVASAARDAGIDLAAKDHWQCCHEVLRGMRESGVELDTQMQQLLERLDADAT